MKTHPPSLDTLDPMRIPDFWRPTLSGADAVRSVAGSGALAVLLLLMARNLDMSHLFTEIAGMGSSPMTQSWAPAALTAWSVVAAVVLSVTKVFPRPTCAVLPGLLLLNLVLFKTGYSALIVTCWAMLHLGRYAPQKWRTPAWIAAVAGVAVSVFVRSSAILREEFILQVNFFVVSLLVLGFFWMVGASRRRRDMEFESLQAKAELAAITERTRIAREMHDIIAHSLTGVIAQADGGRYIAAKHPEKATEALETIAATSRSALAQMRELLSVLRESSSLDDGSLTPAPGLDAIPHLIRDSERSGLQVTYRETGERRNLDPTEQLTVYRIIQESLTNVMKHSGPVETSVTLTWMRRDLVIVVHNAPGKGPGGGSGRGITGMMERVSLHGGALATDSTDGFTVTARIPVKQK